MGKLGMLQFQKVTPWHAEDAHFDGGASSVILTITLWGARELTLFGKKDAEAEDMAEHSIENLPGSVYCSCLCPIFHQVRYPTRLTRKLARHDIANIPGLGEAGVSVIFRADIFGGAMATVAKKSLPGPVPVFQIFMETFDRFLQVCGFRLPSMDEVLACAKEKEEIRDI